MDTSKFEEIRALTDELHKVAHYAGLIYGVTVDRISEILKECSTDNLTVADKLKAAIFLINGEMEKVKRSADAQPG